MSIQPDSDAEIRYRVEGRLKKRGEFYIHLTVYAAVILSLWAVWLLAGAGFPWPLMITLPWGAGLAGHGMDMYFGAAGPAVRREQVIREMMQQIYGDDWAVNATQADYNRIRLSIEKDFNKRKEFFIHLSVYLPVNLLFWLAWLLTRDTVGFPWPLLISLGWGMGLVAHAVDTYFQTGNRIRAREESIQREIERERERMYLEKPKRSRLVIADDGELMEVAEDTWEQEEKPKRGRRT